MGSRGLRARRALSPRWLLAVLAAALIAGAATASRAERGAITAQDRFARPELHRALERMLDPWRQLHHACTSAVLLRIAAGDPALLDKLRTGDVARFGDPLEAAMTRALSHCAPYLQAAGEEVAHWNTAVPSAPVAAFYWQALRETSLRGAFEGAKGALVYYLEAADSYDIPDRDTWLARYRELSRPGQPLAIEEAAFGAHAGLLKAAHRRLLMRLEGESLPLWHP